MTGTFHKSTLRTTLGLALTLGAITPAAASARPDLNSTAAVSPVVAEHVYVAPHHTALPPVHMPAGPDPALVAVSATSSGGGFDWADGGIGAAAGVGLSLLALGGGRLVTGQRRERGPGRSAAVTSS